MSFFNNDADDLEKIPRTSGLYYFYDKDDKLLYIGKAKNLRYRIRDHIKSNNFHREGMFFHKLLTSKGLLNKDRKEWPKELIRSVSSFEARGFNALNPLVIDQIFHQVKQIKIEEISYELIDSKEKEMILKFEPPFNYETASSDYYSYQSLELD